MEKPSGEISYTGGSWDKSVLTAEVGGPTTIADKSAGFYLYAELEDSGSYYNNDFNQQSLLQGSFNIDLTPNTRIEMGGMYQNWSGHENGGWNRVTQDLVNNGTYITGIPAVNIDATYGGALGSLDGLMNEAEIDAFEASLAGLVSTGVPFAGAGEISCFTGLSVFCFNGNFGLVDASQITQDLVDQLGLGLDPTTVGTAQLDGSQVLISATDQYDTEVHTFYFDIIHNFESGWTMTNKIFYDAQEYTNVDGYGFTKVADAWVIEDQLIFANEYETDNAIFKVQLSPSFRYTDAFYALDFSDEIFDRVDLTRGFDSYSLQSVPSRNLDDSWSDYWNSNYSQLGFAVMTDTTLYEKLNLVLGARYDYVDAESENGDGDGPIVLRSLDSNGEYKASDTDDGFSWNASLSYSFPVGITPYVTLAESTNIVAGSVGELDSQNVLEKTFLAESDLTEFGIKGSFLDGRLFAAVAVYEQNRIAFSAQNPVNNQPTKSEGTEYELRWVPIDDLSIIATYSDSEITITTGGSTFSYFGAVDMPLVDPSTWFGGIIGGNTVVDNEALRGGIPKKTGSLIMSYNFTDKVRGSLSGTHVDKVESSVLGGIVLPSYTVINASLTYSGDSYDAGLYVNNITDEQYFRGNFPSLYGNNAILPELPINWTAKFTYKF